MVDLKSKLRAKFPRRHSGIPSLTSDTSNKSNKSNSSSSRPRSECAASSPTDGFAPAAASSAATTPVAEAPASAVVDQSEKQEPSHSSALQTATQPEQRDKLKQTANQESGIGRLAQGETTTDVTNASNAINRCNGHANAAPLGSKFENAVNATMVTATADGSNGTTARVAKNATSSHPRATGITSVHLPQHADNTTLDSSCSFGDGFVDRRISTASRVSALSSINESTDDISKTATDSDATAPEPDLNHTAVRRIRLQDPPVSFDSSSTPTPTSAPITPRPHIPALPADSSASPIVTSSGSQLRSPNSAARPAAPPRRQSLLPSRQTTLIRTLLSTTQPDDTDLAAAEQLLPISATMVTRKIWVKRPRGSATLVTINEEDLVDDVRELILRKYANSLGRQFDAPDLMLRIVPREQQRQERFLGPEEPMARTLDAYYPGGQNVEEALIIDAPQRRTPRPSPRTGPPHAPNMTSVYAEDARPPETGTDYFGPGAVANIPVTLAGPSVNGNTHSISVLSTGQVPQIPSPGGTKSRTYRERPDRPRLGRQHTSSPTILNLVSAGGPTASLAAAATTAATTTAAAAAAASLTTSLGTIGPTGTQQTSEKGPLVRTHSDSPDLPNGGPALPSAAPHAAPLAPPLPTPPEQPESTTPTSLPARIATPPPKPASPRPSAATLVARAKKKKADTPALPAGLMLNGGVPPINVLIVEDNIINLRLLEAFIKRLKVRWATAMNGREAVEKWRNGGFHLVLMDIQLPIMNGLEATREIRRLERVNSIGAFSSAPSGIIYPKGKKPKDGDKEPEKDEKKEEPVPVKSTEDDILKNRELFKSPVIIVALTASSLQSDRHDALAAGCNDFLTKPVTYVWLERKVMEWGCMQALIDFDGWRKWKSYLANPEEEAKKNRAKKNRPSVANSSVDSSNK